MLKAFIFAFILGMLLLAASGVEGFPPQVQGFQQQRKEQAYRADIADATPAELGVFTERQRFYSKLFSFYQVMSNKKIGELVTESTGGKIGKFFYIGVGEVLSEDTPENYFSKLVKETDAIIGGKAVKKTSQITEDETFIFTDYDVVVTEIYKNHKAASLTPGLTISVIRPGGTVIIGDVIVEVRDDDFLPLPVNQENLVLFLNFIPETGAYQSKLGAGSFELGGEAVQPLTKAHFPPGVIRDRRSFLQVIRALADK